MSTSVRKIKEDIQAVVVESITLMDEKGRYNQGSNSKILWEREWDELRNNLLVILQICRS